MREELTDVKVGDVVVRFSGWNGKSLVKVTHATPTRIYVGFSKYRRKDGHMIGGDNWTRDWIVKPTPELVAEVREKQDRRKLANLEIEKLPIEVVRAMLAAVPEQKEDEA